MSGRAGRPPGYCSEGCQRSAQSERQRVGRHLERLEAECMELRHAVARGAPIGIVSSAGIVRPAERLADVEGDIARLRSRLRELLDSG
jgi:hypothetical protein